MQAHFDDIETAVLPACSGAWLRASALLCPLLLFSLLSPDLNTRESLPRIGIFPLVLETDDSRLAIMAGEVNSTLALTLRLMGGYEVLE